MSDPGRPHRRQPTRLPRPWDSPGKNSGVGCHFLLQCMKVKSEREVAQSCLTPCDPMNCSLPVSSVHARVLEWDAITSPVGQVKHQEESLPWLGLASKEPQILPADVLRCETIPPVTERPWHLVRAVPSQFKSFAPSWDSIARKALASYCL